MKINIVAVYPVHVPELDGQPGIVLRKRRDAAVTQVPCDLVETETGTVAKPALTPPAGTPAPCYRAQLETAQNGDAPAKHVAIPLQVDTSAKVVDPEQRILAPLFNNGRRILFEFQRAEIMLLARDGRVEIRYVAVNPDSGQVGTETQHSFHRRYVKLVSRAADYLNGLVDLFPPRPATPRTAVPVPKGKANLAFGEPAIPRVDARTA